MFGLDRSFNVEISEVAQTYKNLQRQLHPDKVSGLNFEKYVH